MQDSLPASSNSESDIIPSPSRSPSPAISNSSSKSFNSDHKPSKKKKKKKKKKTVLVFLSPTKSKSSRSLFKNIKKKRRNSKLRKQLKKLNLPNTLNKTVPIIRIRSAPTTPNNTNNNNNNNKQMANVNHLKDEYEAQQRRNSYHHHNNSKRNKNTFETNIGYRPSDNNPYKISNAYYNKQLPSNNNNMNNIGNKPYIDNDNNNNNNNIDDHLRSNNHRHHKSRSHVLMQSPTSISRSKSPSHSQNINGYNSNKYTGICPHCNHESPLLDYIIPSNRHSYLAELRDKLAAIESISSMLKQEILQVQSKSNLSGSDGNLHSASSINNKKNKNHHKKKEVSNPYQNDGHIGSSYLLINLTTQQQQALSLLTTQKKITFPLKGTAMISPQENTPYFDKFKEMRKNFGSQEFFIGLDSETRTFTVHTKYKNNDSKGKDKNTKQYRQIRSFSSLNGAEFESAKDNVLKIWFKNTRGYFLISFASETEANTVLSLVNIIVNNSELSSDIGHQLIWASYIEKKGKRLGFYSQKFVCLISPTNIKLYKTHINYNNGEEPSQLINLMECDLSRDKKEIKFNDKNKNQDNNNKKQPLLSIKLIIEVERDDFLNLCAQTLGKAIQSSMGINVQSPSTTMSVAPDNNNNAMKDSNSWNLAERDEDMSGTDAEDSEYYMDEHKRGYSINDGDNDNIYIDDDDDLLAFKSMTMTLRGPPQINLTNNNKLKKNNAIYLEILNNTPRMYGAGLHKALDRLAKKRPSDIDFIEIQHQFDGNEIIYMNMNINSNERKKRESNTYKLLDVLGKSMISGAFLNKKLYLHKAVWEQNKVMVVNYEKKLEIFNIILLSLDKLFKTDNISIDWLKSDFKNNCNIFHNKLTKCEKKLRDVQNILTDMIEKSKQKAREKGAAKLLNKFKEKTKVKVFDNQPYRDLIYKICGHASSMQLYYIYLNKTNTNNNSFSSETKMLLNDIKGITLCMNSFGNVVIGDVKEYLSAYLRRGSKNIYQ